jgi:hypothetical protein
MANKYEMFTTPRGVFIYPHLTEADTKFVKPDGEYHTKFALTPEESQPLIEKVEEVLEAYIEANEKELKPAQIKKAGRDRSVHLQVQTEGEGRDEDQELAATAALVRLGSAADQGHAQHLDRQRG